MSKRREWVFSFTPGQLVEACERKLTYHEGRCAWWKNEGDVAEAELRAHGIELREYQVSGGSRIDAVFDPARQQRLGECRQKERTHARQADEYRAYAYGLRQHDADSTSLFGCDADDIVWLGLVEQDEGEEGETR